MRATHSRFTSFVAPVFPDVEGGPSRAAMPSAPSSGGLSVLEQRYPAVVRTLTLMWGYPELNDYLNRVATGVDARLSHIEPAAMAELMVLAELHRLVCPQVASHRIDEVYGAAKRSGPWRSARYRG